MTNVRVFLRDTVGGKKTGTSVRNKGKRKEIAADAAEGRKAKNGSDALTVAIKW